MKNNNDNSSIKIIVFLIIGCIAGMALGGLIFWRGFKLGGNDNSSAFSYNDYSAFLLTFVAILLAILGTVLAVLAFVGFRYLNNTVKERAEDTAKSALDDSLSEGGVLFGSIIERISDEHPLGKAMIVAAEKLYIASIQDNDIEGDELEVGGAGEEVHPDE